MYARSLALCSLLLASPGFLRSAPPIPVRSNSLNLYLRTDGGSSVDTLTEMRSELAALMRPTAFQVHWRYGNRATGKQEGVLVVVDLEGSCTPPEGTLPPEGRATVRVASSAVANGVVLPFARVDCTALNRVLSADISAQSEPSQERSYGRALARVLAHELYHLLGQTTDHTRQGLTKARIGRSELLGEHVGFTSGALARFSRLP